MKGVHLKDDGNVEEILFTISRDCIKLKKNKMHILFQTNDIVFVSPSTINNIINGHFFNYELPPPLNKFIYPTPLFAVGYKNNQYVDLTTTTFLQICKQCSDTVYKIQQDMTVYDVPLNIEEEEEEEVMDEESGDDESEQDSEEEWDEDDEDDTPLPKN